MKLNKINISIILFLIIFIFGCSGGGDNKTPESVTCSSQGGNLCVNPPGCSLDVNSIYADDAGNNVCCLGECYKQKSIKVENKISYSGGDFGLPCAQQKGHVCSSNEFCDAWIKSSDSTRCCTSLCTERKISKEIIFPEIFGGKIKVEKLNSQHIVWWGESKESKAFDEALGFKAIGLSEKSYAKCDNDICTFTAKDNNGEKKEFSIHLLDQDGKLYVSKEKVIEEKVDKKLKKDIIEDDIKEKKEETDEQKVNNIENEKNIKKDTKKEENNIKKDDNSIQQKNEFPQLPENIKSSASVSKVTKNGLLLSPGWYLFGANEDISKEIFSDCGNYVIWTFNDSWHKNPDVIKQGQGFWINPEKECTINLPKYSGHELKGLEDGWNLVNLDSIRKNNILNPNICNKFFNKAFTHDNNWRVFYIKNEINSKNNLGAWVLCGESQQKELCDGRDNNGDGNIDKELKMEQIATRTYRGVSIFEDKVVYVKINKIFLLNLKTNEEIFITDTQYGDATSISISEDKIIWWHRDAYGDDSKIHMYDLSNKKIKLITTNKRKGHEGKISNRKIVWPEEDGIYLYDLISNKKEKLLDDVRSNVFDFSKNKIIFISNLKVKIYDISTKEETVIANYLPDSLSISNDIAIIRIYNTVTKVDLSENTQEKLLTNLDLSTKLRETKFKDNLLFWPSSDFKLNIFNIDTNKNIKTNLFWPKSVDVSNNKIVTENSGKIFLYNLNKAPVSESCYSGNAKTSNIGACRAGKKTCDKGKLSECISEILPEKEKCDGLDNNCDGFTDNIDRINNGINEICNNGVWQKGFDWRKKGGINWMTSVKNQGSCGSCWSFATTGPIEAAYNIQNNNPDLDIDLSEQDLISCANYPGIHGCQGTANLVYPFKYIKENGILTEDCFQYQASEVQCNPKCNNRYYIKDYEFIEPYKVKPYSKENVKNKMKEFLKTKGPMGIGIVVPSKFTEKDIGICESGKYSGVHAVTLVGYNDDEKYWIIKNQYGTNWFDKGYGKIAYDNCNIEDFRNIAGHLPILEGDSK